MLDFKGFVMIQVVLLFIATALILMWMERLRKNRAEERARITAAEQRRYQERQQAISRDLRDCLSYAAESQALRASDALADGQIPDFHPIWRDLMRAIASNAPPKVFAAALALFNRETELLLARRDQQPPPAPETEGEMEGLRQALTEAAARAGIPL